jgi:hypothetical protein
MEKKLIRTLRTRQLTPEEVARDNVARKAVTDEFPPRRSVAASQQAPLSAMLKQAIRDSGRPVESVASDAGLSQALLAAFMAGERDIHMSTADNLAQVLGLEVTAD